ncbi:MAG TPA: ABC transporter permease [Thermoanaerobaculia bacterium]|nr:ABC transporter permease [Thermoanaerobaculia bacterium]
MSRRPRAASRAALDERLVRAGLAWLQPADRERFGDELALCYRERRREAVTRGAAAVLGLLASELLGLARLALGRRWPSRWARRTARHLGLGPPRPVRATMRHLLADLRFSVRAFARRPAMTLLAALSLALGVGASTAMFSVVDTVLVRPLPFPEPERLVSVYPTTPSLEGHPTLGGMADRATFSLPEVWTVREQQSSFEHLGAYLWSSTTLSSDGPAERLFEGVITPGLLEALGVTPIAGRLLDSEADDPRQGARTVMLSEGRWRSRFAADPGVIGSTLVLDDEPFTVVGVLPRTVEAAVLDVDVWQLVTGTPADGNIGNHNVAGAIGRLREGVTPEQARGELATILGAIPDHGDHGASVFPRLVDQTRSVRPALLVLIAGAVVLLLVGCANTALILLGQGLDRQQELAVRGALGAGRPRLVGQLLAESSLVTLLGAVGGVALAGALTQVLLAFAPEGVPRLEEAAIDGRVLAVGLGIAALCGTVFGLAPAFGLSRPDLASAMGGQRGTSAGRSWLQDGLVVGELTLATLLLVSAALLGRTLAALNGVDPGFDSEELVAVRLAPPFQRLQQEDEEAFYGAVDAYFQRLVDEIAALPEVEAVAVTSVMPLTGDRGNNDVMPEGWDPETDGSLLAERRFVSIGFFETVGTRIVDGRPFDTRDDRADAAPAVIVSQGLARRVWGDESAVGKRMSFWGREPATIVGVAADVRDESLQSPTAYAFYAPARQVGPQTGSLIVRSHADPSQLGDAIRQRVFAFDPDVPVSSVTPFEQLIGDSTSSQRYRARLMGAFGALAALFAMLGVYGLTARSVARRTREMGIRVALGAARSQVMRLVLARGLGLAAVGAGLGLVVSLFATRAVEGFLFGVSRLDPVSLVGIALVIAAGSLVACLPPSRRATRVDPTVALRDS